MKQIIIVLILLLCMSVTIGTVTWRRAFAYPQGEPHALTLVGAVGLLVGALAFAVALAITMV